MCPNPSSSKFSKLTEFRVILTPNCFFNRVGTREGCVHILDPVPWCNPNVRAGPLVTQDIRTRIIPITV